jgi:hypothetical protein
LSAAPENRQPVLLLLPLLLLLLQEFTATAHTRLTHPLSNLLAPHLAVAVGVQPKCNEDSQINCLQHQMQPQRHWKAQACECEQCNADGCSSSSSSRLIVCITNAGEWHLKSKILNVSSAMRMAAAAAAAAG